MASIRKVVCISYKTGKKVTRNGQTYPDSKLLTVGQPSWMRNRAASKDSFWRSHPSGAASS
jgi:hypothetical protein